MRKRFFALPTLVFFLVISVSCSNMKYLPEGEKLYTGAEVKLVTTEKINDTGSLKKEAESVLRPKPNSKIVGLRVKLWLYNIAGTPKGKGIRYWLKNKVGEPPVLLSEAKPEQVSDLIDARLFNNGVFRVVTDYKIKDSGYKSKIVYNSHIHRPYEIAEVAWPTESDSLNADLRSLSSKSLLRKGERYSLDKFQSERSRIDEKLKERGYFYFNPDYILFNVDTTSGNKTVNTSVTIKPDIPSSARIVYHINEVYLNTDFSLTSDSLSDKKDTLLIDNVHYIYSYQSYRPKSLLRSIFLRKGEIYSRTNHNMTLNRLMGMGVFKFVNIRFNEVDSLSPSKLNTYIYLTALPKKSIRAEFEIISKSNNFVGPSLTISYNNRNAFGGAELLSYNVHGSFETQLNGKYKGLFSYEIGPEINLYIPRFILPFSIKSRNGYFIPKTRITAGYDFLKRVQYFNLNSLKFIFGYKWKETELKEHELNPVNISYTKLSNESDQFNKMLEINELLKKSFEEQFIAGLNYSYTYNQQILEKKRNQTYINFNAESSGNTISFFSKILFNKKANTEQPLTIAGAVYSQFIRADIDVRHFRKLSPNTKLAGRIYAGIGKAFGNSSTLPYIKQFFSGGVSSVRAFRARSLGPGTYSNEGETNSFFEQGGDIKLEANLEYRYGIISILKGAVFADAGNIWLLKDNPSVPGGKFNTRTFMKETAIGTGVGFRIDANFFVLRFDIAFPLRKPSLAAGNRWVYKQIRPFSADWRSENLILNIAIGYPF